MSDNLKQDALDYHRYPTPGKISVTPTKAMATQRDLGPILLGLAQPAHILTPTATVRRIVNMSALASVDCASEWSSRTATSVLSQIRAGTDQLA